MSYPSFSRFSKSDTYVPPPFRSGGDYYRPSTPSPPYTSSSSSSSSSAAASSSSLQSQQSRGRSDDHSRPPKRQNRSPPSPPRSKFGRFESLPSWRNRPQTPPQSPDRPSRRNIEPERQALSYNDARPGTICWLPSMDRVPFNDPILRHEDFQNNPLAFGHPCVLVSRPNSEGLVLCLQITSFGRFKGGIMQKYDGDKLRDHRRRWLLIEHHREGALREHDETPTLRTVGDVDLNKQSYVNTHRLFCINHELLTPAHKQLDERSTLTIIDWHNMLYSNSDEHGLPALEAWDPDTRHHGRSLIPESHSERRPARQTSPPFYLRRGG